MNEFASVDPILESWAHQNKLNLLKEDDWGLRSFVLGSLTLWALPPEPDGSVSVRIADSARGNSGKVFRAYLDTLTDVLDEALFWIRRELGGRSELGAVPDPLLLKTAKSVNSLFAKYLPDPLARSEADPAKRLELLLQTAVQDPRKRSDFLRQLFRFDFFVLGSFLDREEGASMCLEYAEYNSETHFSFAYTSQAALEHSVKVNQYATQEFIEMPGFDLFEFLGAEMGLTINLGMEFGMYISAREVSLILAYYKRLGYRATEQRS